MMRYFLIALATLAAVPAAADQMVGQYTAFIGQNDLYNSKGKRLTEPWQILRQDRANYHRFGVSQPGDEWDPYFGNADNRSAMERMVMNGRLDPRAVRTVVNGGAMVVVRIYGEGNIGRRVEVDVFN